MREADCLRGSFGGLCISQLPAPRCLTVPDTCKPQKEKWTLAQCVGVLGHSQLAPRQSKVAEEACIRPGRHKAEKDPAGEGNGAFKCHASTDPLASHQASLPKCCEELICWEDQIPTVQSLPQAPLVSTHEAWRGTPDMNHNSLAR